MQAAAHGHTMTVRAFITAGTEVKITDTYQETALVCAAMNGNDTCFGALIKAGAYVNRGSALVQTAGNRHAGCVALLLGAGADVTRYGSAALMEAVKNGSHDAVAMLSGAGGDVNAMDEC